MYTFLCPCIWIWSKENLLLWIRYTYAIKSLLENYRVMDLNVTPNTGINTYIFIAGCCSRFCLAGHPIFILQQLRTICPTRIRYHYFDYTRKLWLHVRYHDIQYIPRNMHTFFALLCFVVVIHWLVFPYPSGLLHWHCGNLTIAPVPAKQPWWIWINTSCKFIMNDCITTTKQSTTKPCAYFLGYTVEALSELLFRCEEAGHQWIALTKGSVIRSFGVSLLLILKGCWKENSPLIRDAMTLVWCNCAWNKWLASACVLCVSSTQQFIYTVYAFWFDNLRPGDGYKHGGTRSSLDRIMAWRCIWHNAVMLSIRP